MERLRSILIPILRFPGVLPGLKKTFFTTSGAFSKASLTPSRYSTFIENVWVSWRGSLLEFTFYVSNHFIRRIEGTMERPFLGFGQLGVDNTALLGCVLVDGGWRFGGDGDHAAADPELHLIAARQVGAALNCRWYQQRSFVLYSDDHGVQTRLRAWRFRSLAFVRIARNREKAQTRAGPDRFLNGQAGSRVSWSGAPR